jgi:hypothetical protein
MLFPQIIAFVEANGLSSEEILALGITRYLPVLSCLMNKFNPNSVSIISAYPAINTMNRSGSLCISNFSQLYGPDLSNTYSRIMFLQIVNPGTNRRSVNFQILRAYILPAAPAFL